MDRVDNLKGQGIIRVIARLDIKGSSLIKGIQLEGLRPIGDPCTTAVRYYTEGIDEILVNDVVASLYGRDHLENLVKLIAMDVQVPITVGGGVRSISDFEALLRAGADKVALNTAAVADQDLVRRLARKFGRQSVVISIEAKQTSLGRWEVFTNSGREPTGLIAHEWAQQVTDCGAGECLITSIDADGTRRGFDIALCASLSANIEVPTIAAGGLGNSTHAIELLDGADVQAIAIGSALHFGDVSIAGLKQELRKEGYQMRREPECLTAR